MFEHKTIQWIVGILSIALCIYMISLMFSEDGRSIFQSEPQQEYVTAAVDSSVPVYQISSHRPIPVPTDTLNVTEMRTVVAVVDSDSITHYDLYRHQQEVVTIDPEEHKEKVFFTWDDICAYYRTVIDFFTELINKI